MRGYRYGSGYENSKVSLEVKWAKFDDKLPMEKEEGRGVKDDSVLGLNSWVESGVIFYVRKC